MHSLHAAGVAPLIASASLYAPPPAAVKATFDFRPGMIGKALDLKRGGDR